MRCRSPNILEERCGNDQWLPGRQWSVSNAIYNFSVAYADQAERDHAALKAAGRKERSRRLIMGGEHSIRLAKVINAHRRGARSAAGRAPGRHHSANTRGDDGNTHSADANVSSAKSNRDSYQRDSDCYHRNTYGPWTNARLTSEREAAQKQHCDSNRIGDSQCEPCITD